MNERERFLADMTENVLLPYEVSQEYEGKDVGEFENPLEEYFQHFVTLVGPRALVLDLACGDGRHTLSLTDRWAALPTSLSRRLNNDALLSRERGWP